MGGNVCDVGKRTWSSWQIVKQVFYRKKEREKEREYLTFTLNTILSDGFCPLNDVGLV
jgi:hypothetical protein